MTAATSQRLADALRAAGILTLAERAEKDEFHDYLSPHATPTIILANELVGIINDTTHEQHTRTAAHNIRVRVINGEFDATEEESNEWAASAEGQATFDRLVKDVSSKPTSGDAPIEPEFRDKMNKLARSLQTLFNGAGTRIKDSKVGFMLMVFHMETHEGRANYISNANREDVVTMLKHQIARFEGMPDRNVKGDLQ